MIKYCYMKYSLGLDLGTTSIGWSVVNLDKNRIEDLGVRIFEKPENPKDGKSLSVPRRTARSARRRLRRRRQRLNFLKDFIVDNGIMDRAEVEKTLTPHKGQKNPYELRRKGLNEKLEPDELVVALYHIAKRRGYKSNRKAVEESDSDGRKVLGAISDNAKLLDDGRKTVAEALLANDKFAAHKRNKRDSYTNSFYRTDFENEMKAILEKQQEYYPQLNDENINKLLYEKNRGLFYQRPFMTPDLIRKMQGKCPFEKGQPRLQKASYTFELFRVAQDLAHLSYTARDEVSGELEPGQMLTHDEIMACIDKCKATRKVTYKAIREVLGHKGDEDFSFDYIRGKQPKAEDLADDKFAMEKNEFAQMKFYHDVKKALKNQPEDWSRIEKDIDLFDKIGEVLTFNKDDDDIKNEFTELGFGDDSVTELLKLNYSGFGHLSSKAIRKITKYIIGDEQHEPMTYDKAVVAAGYEFKQKLHGDKSKLPPLSENERNQITNPIVKRAISQTIKVVNAIIRKYGAPDRICIESAGELAKNFKERNEIKKRQDENAAQNEKIKERLINEFNILTPTGTQISKMKFYLEQDGKCLYSGQDIDLNRLFSDEGYCEIDHIIPFSRCGNDTRANKALVLNKCNQEKGNKTPFETWGGDPERWQRFCAEVESHKQISPYKKKRLMSEKLPKEDWNVRALNDTRYIERFLAKYFRKNLRFADRAEVSAGHDTQRVFTPTGQITTNLRRVWHIGNKNRDDDCLHHSVDATIIALTNQGTIARLARFYEVHEDQAAWHYDKKSHTYIDKKTGEVKDIDEVLPWPEFDKEIRLRESQPKENTVDAMRDWRDQFRDLYKDQDAEFVASIHPIFVSRMPKRRGSGQVNKETVRSPKSKDGGLRLTRKPLSDVNLSVLEKSVLPESDKKLYQQLKDRLLQHGDDPKKAFDEPVYKNNKKYDKNGRPLSPVSSIKVYDVSPETSGFTLKDRGREVGYVNNGSMIRLNIYKHVNSKGKAKYYGVPVYAHQTRTGSRLILPAPKDAPQLIDDSFTKVCALFPNDYVRLISNGKPTQEGYYVKYGIGDGGMVIKNHLSAGNAMTRNCGIKSVDSIERLDIDVLGDNYPWK